LLNFRDRFTVGETKEGQGRKGEKEGRKKERRDMGK